MARLKSIKVYLVPTVGRVPFRTVLYQHLNCIKPDRSGKGNWKESRKLKSFADVGITKWTGNWRISRLTLYEKWNCFHVLYFDVLVQLQFLFCSWKDTRKIDSMLYFVRVVSLTYFNDVEYFHRCFREGSFCIVPKHETWVSFRDILVAHDTVLY